MTAEKRARTLRNGDIRFNILLIIPSLRLKFSSRR